MLPVLPPPGGVPRLPSLSPFPFLAHFHFFQFSPLFHVIVKLKFHSPVSPDPITARSLRSLGFPKSPPLKNPRSANETSLYSYKDDTPSSYSDLHRYSLKHIKVFQFGMLLVQPTTIRLPHSLTYLRIDTGRM